VNITQLTGHALLDAVVRDDNGYQWV